MVCDRAVDLLLTADEHVTYIQNLLDPRDDPRDEPVDGS